MGRRRLNVGIDRQMGERPTAGHKPTVIPGEIGVSLSAVPSRQRHLKVNGRGPKADLRSELQRLKDEVTGLRFQLEASEGQAQTLLSERNRLARELRSLRKAVRIVRLAVEDFPAGLIAEEEGVAIPDKGVEQRADPH